MTDDTDFLNQWSKSFYGKFKFGFIYFISTIDRGWNLITLLHLVLTQNVYVVIHIRRQTVSLSQNENTPRWVIVWNVGGLETPPIKRFNTLCAISGQHFITHTPCYCIQSRQTKDFFKLFLAYAQYFQVSTANLLNERKRKKNTIMYFLSLL